MRFTVTIVFLLGLTLFSLSYPMKKNDFMGILWEADEVIFDESTDEPIKLHLTLLFINDGHFTASTTIHVHDPDSGRKESQTQEIFGDWSKQNTFVYMKNTKKFHVKGPEIDSDVLERISYYTKVGFDQTYFVDYVGDRLVLTSTHEGGAMIVLSKKYKEN